MSFKTSGNVSVYLVENFEVKFCNVNFYSFKYLVTCFDPWLTVVSHIQTPMSNEAEFDRDRRILIDKFPSGFSESNHRGEFATKQAKIALEAIAGDFIFVVEN